MSRAAKLQEWAEGRPSLVASWRSCLCRKPLGIDDMAEYLKQSLQASNRHMLQYGSGALRELPPRASAAEAPSASTSAARAGPATAEQAPSPDRDDLEGLVDEVLGPQGLNGSLPVDPADLPEELQGRVRDCTAVHVVSYQLT